MARFWWGQRGTERKIHWLSWERLCQRKNQGGLGFRNLHHFNLALLAKQGWRLFQNEHSLRHQLLKAKYFPQSSFFQAGLGRCPSYTWQGIWEARKWLMAGCMWRIGSGTAVNIWSEQWIPGHKSLLAEGVVVRDDVRMNVVNSLFLPNARVWDIPKLRALFDPNVVNDILKIQLFSGGMDDCRVWSLERNGMFSVKSCYRVIQDSLGSPFPEASSQRRPLLLWKHLWKMKVPNKIKNFAWRACQNGLPVGSLLQQKRILADPTCKLCLSAP
ncbi:hypothetical protein I3760_12G011500 [Carya illinoinensis]|nr:hypothetical protein I3760_12G011500 [Carya illinoinensis]